MTFDGRRGDEPRKPLRRLRFLIAEDELMVAWHLVDMVHELGHIICETVSTEDAAIEAAFRLRPDVILMDYRLKNGGDGTLAARRIRETANIPIVFCTAYSDVSRTDIPNTCFVSKPVRSSSLKSAIDKLR